MTPDKTLLTTEKVAARFDELAQQEKWFDIHDELFADTVRSIEPPTSPYFKSAAGKLAVRQKGENWVKKVLDFHGAYTTHPVIGGNHFAVGRSFDITVQGFGRIKMEELMVYEVKDGKIVVEQFLY
ncbi:hypothetical protein GCM10028808_57620 [Spirosoma migulaei]